MNLSELLQQFYIRMGQSHSGYATGGTTATLLDSFRNGEGRDRAWKNGSLFIVETTDNAAPEGEFSRITASLAGTWTLTVSPTLTVAPEAGDLYLFSGPEYPLYDMIDIVNSALFKLTKQDKTDTTTLDSVSNQSRYSASASWKYPWGPYRVDVALNTDTDDPQYINQVDFEYEPAEAGSGGYIYFPTYPSHSSRDIRVWYREAHPRVSAYNDSIDGRLDDEVVIQAVLSAALDWNNTRIRGGDRFLLQRSTKAEEDLRDAKAEEPPQRAQPKSKLLRIRHRSRRLWPGDRQPR